MKYHYWLIIIVGMSVTFGANAALKCDMYKCDVTWKTSMGEIDLESVCYTYKNKTEYSECRQLAVKVFAERCEHAINTDNPIWKEVYCDQAVPNYRP